MEENRYSYYPGIATAAPGGKIVECFDDNVSMWHFLIRLAVFILIIALIFHLTRRD